VTSADGTLIGFRRFGRGPGVLLVHGGMMASQNFTKLAESLADDFTVFVPDRRGRGRSGPFGADYGVRKEVDDLVALFEYTRARLVFALSSGAVVSLQCALERPEIEKIALYEPPLSFRDSSSVGWVPRYEREIDRGRIAAAFATIIQGTHDSPVVRRLPRVLLVPLLALALKANTKEVEPGDVPLNDLVATMRYDARLVIELQDRLETFRGVRAPVLLLGGSKSARYLKVALDRLETVLPRVHRVELGGVGHLAADNGGVPARVAAELRRFFAVSPS
jgi:pimeloyl-ACP methyl ester carboxylesterase